MDERRPEGAPLTIPEAAAFTGLKASYLYKLACLGKVPYYKPRGGRLYFTRADLEAFTLRGRRSADYELDGHADAFLDRGRA
jgi:excisionase family DNA binding protein